MNEEKQPIGVIGVGWVGLVTAACFAELGHEVHAVDIAADKVEALRAGRAPIHEPGIEELLQRNAERLHFTTEIADVLEGARLLFCCVDTPPTYSGDADLSRVKAVVGALPEGNDHALVMKSTVPSGTGAAIRRDRPDLPYVSCPEFLKEGTAVEDFLNPDRVVIGADDPESWEALAVVEAYSVLGGERVVTDVASAEMIKLASNAFLATKISFINEIANVCEETGADVVEVARGMGLDERIGSAFLRAGVGYGGSCFSAAETVLVRISGRARLLRFDQLWEAAGGDPDDDRPEVLRPDALEAWSWQRGTPRPAWYQVSVLTRRPYEGEMIELRTKLGRRLRVTADHPFLATDGSRGSEPRIRQARELDSGCWLPLAQGSGEGFAPARYPVLGNILDHESVGPDELIVRPREEAMETFAAMVPRQRVAALGHPRGRHRAHDIVKSGAMRLGEAAACELDLRGARMKTARNGTACPSELDIDERFWRVAGLYLAEGCVSRDGDRRRIMWSFHPRDEEHLVDEVVSYWASQGVKTSVSRTPTSASVLISSRVLESWWCDVIGFGRSSYEQRVPDLAWEQTAERKRALLSGLWEGDGSWSLIGGGPSVILEWGTISDELADGVARLLGDLGLACSWRRGRTSKSTKITHWLRISGADQVERALFLVPESERVAVAASLARQSKRIAPTGFRRDGDQTWVRVTAAERRPTRGETVYSLEVPASHTVVTSGSLIAHNCFPKDVSALKQLAGNTGYHFQLLNAVIEVNELQKRRVVAKLAKHLGTLVGKRVALLGLAFKPNTDDMREASSLVLAARLQGEGASVVAYDPVAEPQAAELLPAVELAETAELALAGADACVVVTEWPEFAELDWAAAGEAMSQPLVIDGRNFLEPAKMRSLGFTYEGIGRGNGPREGGGSAG